jgi:hypothetical protein
MKVLENIEPIAAKTTKKARACKLSGSWGSDISINNVFVEIDAERHTYLGRDVCRCGNGSQG